jgi:hypothetical protein
MKASFQKVETFEIIINLISKFGTQILSLALQLRNQTIFLNTKNYNLTPSTILFRRAKRKLAKEIEKH